jgi:hypothetical protein
VTKKPLRTPWQKVTGNSRSKRQETKLANRPGGQKQINSGRTPIAKRDVRLNGFLFEARTTEKGSYRVERAEFEQIIRDALGTPPGQLPGMQIDFERLQGSTLSLVVTRLEDHEFFVNRCAVLEEKLKEALFGRDTEVE